MSNSNHQTRRALARLTVIHCLPITIAIVALFAFASCSGSATSELPTPSADQAAAMTAIAQGTPASDFATKIARPELTNTPSAGLTPLPSGSKTIRPKATANPKATKPKATPTESDIEPTAVPPPLPKAKGAKLNSPEYSVQAFMWYRPEIADRDLNTIKDMGFGWVKQQFAWRDIEGAAKGAFDWSRSDNVVYAANNKGLDLLARMDNAPDWAAPGCFDSASSSMGPPARTQDWVDFLKAFATRYKGRVRAYQIWNEPNLSREWCKHAPDPSAYAAFLKASYSAIKSADPNALVISAGMTPTTCCPDGAQALPDAQFIERMYDAMRGSSNGFFDLLGIHAAGYKAEPECDPAQVANDPTLTNNDPSAQDLKRIYCFRHVEDIRQIMVDHGDAGKQIAILEFGWTSDPVNPAYAWFRVDEDTKADRIVRAFEYAKSHWAPWIGVMNLIYIANPDWTQSDEKYWWAITNPDGTKRPSFDSLKVMPK